MKTETSCSGKSASVLVRSGDVTPSQPGRQSADPCRGPATPEETNPITRHLHFSWCLPALCTLVSPKVIMSLVPLRLRRLMQPRLSAPLRLARESTGAVSESPLRARRCRESDGGRRGVSRTEEKKPLACSFFCFSVRVLQSISTVFKYISALVCVFVLSRAHVHSGAGRRAGSDPAAAHLPHLPLQVLQNRADALL